ncbi:hypothetical protein ACLB2K_040276 [Fragaria x ananassa]
MLVYFQIAISSWLQLGSILHGLKKRKRKKKRDALAKVQSGSINKYFKPNKEQEQTSTDENGNENENADVIGNGEKPNLRVNEEKRIIAEDDQQDADNSDSIEEPHLRMNEEEIIIAEDD